MDKKKSDDLKVFIGSREAVCSECSTELPRKSWFTLFEEGVLCLSCADFDHLFFLPSGNSALTRRSKKYSKLWAVVLKWGRARRRYERQGLLVEEEALDQASTECLEDHEIRERRRARDAIRRAEQDKEYITKFAQRTRQLFPHCPEGREFIIADHACQKYSGRIGRTRGAKDLEANAIMQAVIAHIRHSETIYDELLMQGCERWDARQEVESEVKRVISVWQGSGGSETDV